MREPADGQTHGQPRGWHGDEAQDEVEQGHHRSHLDAEQEAAIWAIEHGGQHANPFEHAKDKGQEKSDQRNAKARRQGGQEQAEFYTADLSVLAEGSIVDRKVRRTGANHLTIWSELCHAP